MVLKNMGSGKLGRVDRLEEMSFELLSHLYKDSILHSFKNFVSVSSVRRGSVRKTAGADRGGSDPRHHSIFFQEILNFFHVTYLLHKLGKFGLHLWIWSSHCTTIIQFSKLDGVRNEVITLSIN